MRYEVRSEVPEDENGWPTGAAMWEVFDTHNGEAAKFGEDSFADVTEWADRLNNGTANRHDLLWTPPQKNTLPNPSPEIVEAVEPLGPYFVGVQKYRVVSDSRSASARWGVEHIPDGRTAWFGPHKGSAEFALSELVSKNLDPEDMYLWSLPEWETERLGWRDGK